MNPLLSPKRVAELLGVSEKTVSRLKLPVVRIGNQRRYRQEDVDAHISLHVEHSDLKTGGRRHGGGVQKKPQKMGLPVPLSRKQIRALRLAYQGGSQGGGKGTPC
jgi:excisionase family DNA binding protein